MTPVISVIIPVYNRGWQLKRALDSLLCQTDGDFEVIVCDDGSTEDIGAVVEPYLSQLQLRYIRIENSGGPARPRNVAASHACGEWLAFLDSDDWWDNERIAVVKALLHDEADLLYHRLRVVCADEIKRPREKRKVIGDRLRCDVLRHMFLYGNPIPNSAAVLRTSWFKNIGGLSEERELVAFEDFDAWLRVAEAGGEIQFLNQILGSYWVGEDAISGVSEYQVAKQEYLFAKHRSFIPLEIFEYVGAINRLQLATLKLRAVGKDKGQARRLLLSAYPLPTFYLMLKRWVRLLQTFL